VNEAEDCKQAAKCNLPKINHSYYLVLALTFTVLALNLVVFRRTIQTISKKKKFYLTFIVFGNSITKKKKIASQLVGSKL